MYLMNFETRHLQIQAAGRDIASLSARLLSFWREHAKKTGADPDYAMNCLRDGGVRFLRVDFDQLIVNGEVTEQPSTANASGKAVQMLSMSLNQFDARATPLGERDVKLISLDAVTDIVDHAAQLLIAEEALKQRHINADAVFSIKTELADALRCAGVLPDPE